MKLNRTTPARVVLSFDERKRLADFVILLSTVDQRLKKQKAAVRKTKINKTVYNPLDNGPPKKRAFLGNQTLAKFNYFMSLLS